MSDKTGKLTFDEFGELANLLRRFEVHHTEYDSEDENAVMWTEQLVRNVYCALYVPGYAERENEQLRAARRRGMDDENRRQRFEETYRTLLEMAGGQDLPTPTEGELRHAFLNLEHGEALEEYRARKTRQESKGQRV